MTQLTELLERVEKATGPDFSLAYDVEWGAELGKNTCDRMFATLEGKPLPPLVPDPPKDAP